MIISLLSNIAIMLINLYLIWKLSGGISKVRFFNNKQIIQFIILETVTGFFMMNSAITISGIQVDFRPILYAFAMKYLGYKVAIPTVLLMTLIRFLFGVTPAAIMNVAVAIVFVVLIRHLYRFVRKRFSESTQLLILVNFYLLLTLPIFIILEDSLLHAIVILAAISLLYNFVTVTIFSIFKDVRDMTSISSQDGLTTLYNSNKFRSDMEFLSKSQIEFTVMVIDIDYFKQINDTYGHLTGDKVIKEIGRILKGLADNNRPFYRFGGEEFVTIFHDNSGDEAYELAVHIQEELKNIEIPVEDLLPLQVTVSIGIAVRQGNEQVIQTFERADKELYKAKAKGRNRIECEECPVLPDLSEETLKEQQDILV